MNKAPAEQPSVDAPYYREETVRIGRSVHAFDPEQGRCHLALISGHPTIDGRPHKEDHVLLHVIPQDLPIGMGTAVAPPSMVWHRFAQEYPGELPTVFSWHWLRACPWNR